jgi:anti-sigma regulatory factor (Ser/Thr protein kinase)
LASRFTPSGRSVAEDIYRLFCQLLVSKTVSTYNALALQEMLVNAIVHRNYERDEPVTIVIEPANIA